MGNIQSEKQRQLEIIMTSAPVIAVVVVDEPAGAVATAHALVAGGLPVIEITLRTGQALDCLAAIAGEVEGAVTGAGTVLRPAQIAAAEKAGAKFMVSPGASPRLLEASDDHAVPLLPGAATASEIMTLGDRGYRHLKFFPAEPAGGAQYLKALAGPLPHFRFCPTGGVSMANAAQYLALPNVPCVGGSWMAPKDMVERGDKVGLKKLAREAAALNC